MGLLKEFLLRFCELTFPEDDEYDNVDRLFNSLIYTVDPDPDNAIIWRWMREKGMAGVPEEVTFKVVRDCFLELDRWPGISYGLMKKLVDEAE